MTSVLSPCSKNFAPLISFIKTIFQTDHVFFFVFFLKQIPILSPVCIAADKQILTITNSPAVKHTSRSFMPIGGCHVCSYVSAKRADWFSLAFARWQLWARTCALPPPSCLSQSILSASYFVPLTDLAGLVCLSLCCSVHFSSGDQSGS